MSLCRTMTARYTINHIPLGHIIPIFLHVLLETLLLYHLCSEICAFGVLFSFHVRLKVTCYLLRQDTRLVVSYLCKYNRGFHYIVSVNRGCDFTCVRLTEVAVIYESVKQRVSLYMCPCNRGCDNTSVILTEAVTSCDNTCARTTEGLSM